MSRVSNGAKQASSQEDWQRIINEPIAVRQLKDVATSSDKDRDNDRAKGGMAIKSCGKDATPTNKINRTMHPMDKDYEKLSETRSIQWQWQQKNVARGMWWRQDENGQKMPKIEKCWRWQCLIRLQCQRKERPPMWRRGMHYDQSK